MNAGRRFVLFAALAVVSTPAHAHGIPVWMFIAAASPLLVLIFVMLYGWLARNWRAALVHAVLLIFWVSLFWLASNHNEVTLLGIPTDYVIWSALAIYLLHALWLLRLVVVHALKRLQQRTPTA